MLGKSIYISWMLWLLVNLFANGQPNYQDAIFQGLSFQMQADSMQRMVEAQTQTLATAPESQKSGIKIVIRDCNAQAIALQKKADECFFQASKYEGVPANATAEVQSVVDSEVVVQTEPEIAPVAKNAPEKPDDKKSPADDFAILAKSPYSTSKPIPIDQALPGGVAYKIQLGAFSKPLAANAFKGLTPVSGERLSNGVTKYYVGLFRKFADADDALRKVHEYGYKDAYIVAFYNQKVVNPERAKQLESQ